MCRSIKTLRPPYTERVGDAEIRAAALQYVRKVSGFRRPAAHNAVAFDRAVHAVEQATAQLLAALEVRGSRLQDTKLSTTDSTLEPSHDGTEQPE